MMKTKHNFIQNCLQLINLLINTAIIKNEVDRLSSRAQDDENYFILLKRELVTLELFNKIVETAIDTLNKKPFILPGIVPIVMLTRGMLPIDPDLQKQIQIKFLDWITLDPFISKKYQSLLIKTLINFCHESTSIIFTAAAIKKLQKKLDIQLKIFNEVFNREIYQDKSVISDLVADDANSLRMQISSTVCNSLHYWFENSYPTSKLQLLIEVQTPKDSLVNFKFSSAIPWREPQIGQTCKIHAFYSAAWVLHLLNPANTPALPVIHPSIDSKTSLIQQAKQLFSSQIGEVYSPSYIMQLAKFNNLHNVHQITCTPENYVSQLKHIINHGYLGLIYFDVNLDPKEENLSYGHPVNNQSKYEHGAVAFGYMTMRSGKEYIFTYQWEGFYLFDAKQLQNSANQLQRRQGEVFYDIGEGFNTIWIELQRVKEYESEFMSRIEKKEYRQKLFSPPPPKDEPTFRNCIIALGSNLKS